EIHESLLYGVGALRSATIAEGLTFNSALLLSKNRDEVLEVLPILGNFLASPKASSLIRSFDSWQPNSPEDLSDRQDFDDSMHLVLNSTIDGKLFSVDAIQLAAAFAASDQQALWSQFRDRYQSLEKNVAYSSLGAQASLDRMLNFILEKTSPRAEAARELRQVFAARLSAGDLHEYFLLFERDPEGVRRLLAALGRSAESGDLKELMKTARRAFPDPR
ncbi:MAG: hypothetical protein KGQ59_10365, partial [Bdellovibrionales bacterium]|nr:hypothetical protein [Bdellovibrionales bacterium]